MRFLLHRKIESFWIAKHWLRLSETQDSETKQCKKNRLWNSFHDHLLSLSIPLAQRLLASRRFERQFAWRASYVAGRPIQSS
jgi:hypothetical protein